MEVTVTIFLKFLNIINKITNNKEKVNTDKIKNVLKTTSFEKLKQNEIDHGFNEAVPYKEKKDKKIPFFNLGPKNDWKKILNDDFKLKLENVFEKDLKELSYQ